MTIGSNRIGTVRIGDSDVGGTPPAHVPFVRELADAHPDLLIDSPYLVFYDLVVDSNSVHVVDFADSEIAVTPGRMRFDNKDYIPVKVSQPRVSETAEGSFPVVSLDIADPLRVVLGFLRDNNNLQGAKLTMRIIQLKDINTPSLARTRTFFVKEPVSLEGPPRINISFGPPDLGRHTIPSVTFSRALCPNNYERRHVFESDSLTSGKQWCTYPSDDFQELTAQNIETAVWRVLDEETGKQIRMDIGQPVTSTVANVITRHPDSTGVTGSFLTDGFAQNDIVKTGGWSDIQFGSINNGERGPISAITATTMTLGAPASLGPISTQDDGVIILKGTDEEITLENGWRLINGTRLSTFPVGSRQIATNQTDAAESPNRGLYMASLWSGSNEWRGGLREAPFLYKRIIENVKGSASFDVSVGESSVTDLDVNTKLADVSTNFPSGTTGILIQPVTQPSSWIFWGLDEFDFIESDYQLLSRVTTNSSSIDQPFFVEPNVPNAFRVKRVGDTWELYSRTEAEDRFPASLPAWDLHQIVSLTVTGDLNVGLVTFVRLSVAEARALFYHFRFSGGGFDKCNRTLFDCTERENLLQRNAFNDLPDGLVHF